MDSVVPVELGRWAGYCGFQCYCLPCGDTRDLTPDRWRSYVTLMETSYLPGRNAALLASYAAKGFVNPVGPPAFSVADKTVVAAGSSVTITSRNALSGATVYYTTNGQDPRLYGGGMLLLCFIPVLLVCYIVSLLFSSSVILLVCYFVSLLFCESVVL
jgi:hypothetical protein